MLISKLRMAASSSFSADEAPCIDVPPVILTFVFEGAGEDIRDVPLDVGALFGLTSDIRGPDAEGGARDIVGDTTSALA